MISPISTSKIFSVIGNNNSLVPLAMKDVSNSLGLTAASYYVGDKIEGKDRFIDEFGTQAIWLFGIPVYKKAIDLTAYKIMGLSSNVDVRILKDKEILKKAIENAPTEQIAKNIEKISKNAKTFKGLALGKFIASTALTLVSYFGLTQYRHKQTEEKIKQAFLKKQANQTYLNNTVKTNPSFKSLFEKKENKKVSFTSSKPLLDFMFNPVKNLMIVDGGITAERLSSARNKQDFIGYTIKEGGFWFFMYFAGNKIQKFIENKTKKIHNKSIVLDARIIENNDFKKSFEDNSIIKNLKSFDKNAKDAEIYDFIIKNPDNILVKMAKKSDIVKTYKKTGLIDTQKFIDINSFKDLSKNVSNLFDEYKNSDQTSDIFFNQLKKLKRGSVLKNIGACISALGVIIPAIMIAIRLISKDKEFQTKKEIEKALIRNKKV